MQRQLMLLMMMLQTVAVFLLLIHPASASIGVTGFSVHQLDIEHNPSILANSSANTARVFLCWKYLQHGASPIDPSLTVAKAMADGDALTDAFLRREELQSGINRTVQDLQTLAQLGFKLLPSLGDGGANCLPQVTTGNVSDPVAMDPNIVGSELYLAHTYILTRALTRLTAAYSRAIQLANELNYCWVAALGGEFHWKQVGSPGVGLARHAGATGGEQSQEARRAPSSIHLFRAARVMRDQQANASFLVDLVGQWANITFIEELVVVLRKAVRAENSTIPTTINYMADVPSSFAALAQMPHWTTLAEREPWQSASDIVSIDTYPNFLFAQPVQGAVVGDRVRTAVQLAGGKPVWIAETGVSVLRDGAAGPSQPGLAFTEASQAQYYAQAFGNASDAGAQGFICFGWWGDVGIDPPAGGFTSTDQAAVTAASELYLDGTSKLPEFLGFVAENPGYALTRLPALFVNVSTHFGVFDEQHHPRPARDALEALFASTTLLHGDEM